MPTNTTYRSLADLIAAMESIEVDLVAAGDPRRYFHSTYLRTTKAVRDEFARGGFADRDWVERWDIAFAGLYLDAFEGFASTGRAAAPWQVAFTRAADESLPPLRHVLLGMNAHINYDLPQALLAVITPNEFADAALLDRRGRDHRHIDSVLASRVAAEDGELRKVERPGQRSALDRLLTPLNRLGTRRFLREAREKVWHNAHALNRARNESTASYDALLGWLEELSHARVAELSQPGQVLLRLTRRGFGVRL